MFSVARLFWVRGEPELTVYGARSQVKQTARLRIKVNLFSIPSGKTNGTTQRRSLSVLRVYNAPVHTGISICRGLFELVSNAFQGRHVMFIVYYVEMPSLCDLDLWISSHHRQRIILSSHLQIHRFYCPSLPVYCQEMMIL